MCSRGSLTGNPLSLVPDADGLEETQMRAIAREFDQSETTFLLRPNLAGAAWRLRSFTPTGPRSAEPGTTHWERGWGWRQPAGSTVWPPSSARLPSFNIEGSAARSVSEHAPLSAAETREPEPRAAAA
jgi:hypothetical protein